MSSGFSLESLPKIMETKARNNKTTFMDCLVEAIHKTNPKLLLFFHEFVNLDVASKISLETIKQHKEETFNDLQSLHNEIQLHSLSQNSNNIDKFVDVMTVRIVLLLIIIIIIIIITY